MENPYTHVIAELEAEIGRIRQAIQVLRQRASTPVTVSDGIVFGDSVKATVRADPTNEEAIDQVLREAEKPLTIKEIISDAFVLGKTLNINSARWVLHNGEKAGKYVKAKKAGKNLYSLAKG